MEKDYQLLSSRFDKLEVKVEKLDDEVDVLKMSNVEVKAKLINLELGNEQIKNMINESTKENNKVTMKLIDTINTDKEARNKIALSENNIKLADRKEIWGIVALVVGAIITFLSTK